MPKLHHLFCDVGTNTMNILLELFESVILLGTIIFILLISRRMYYGIKSIDWPSTQGTIVNSEIDKFLNSGSDLSRLFFKPLISYQYEVNGKFYKNNGQYSVLPKAFDTKRNADIEISDQIRNGKVIVYYHPKYPKISLLDRRIYKTDYLVLIIPLIFLITFIYKIIR
jgi:hypothetical protein